MVTVSMLNGSTGKLTPVTQNYIVNYVKSLHRHSSNRCKTVKKIRPSLIATPMLGVLEKNDPTFDGQISTRPSKQTTSNVLTKLAYR